MRLHYYTEQESQLIEDNMRGWHGAESLVNFRKLVPRHSAFNRAVLSLNDAGVDWEAAKWAAGQATCRLPQESTSEEITTTAHEILEAYRDAA